MATKLNLNNLGAEISEAEALGYSESNTVGLDRLNITGLDGKTYDLEKMSTTGTRTNTSEKLLVHVWRWCPLISENASHASIENFSDHRYPNPPNPQIGEIWLSKKYNTEAELISAILG